MSDWRWAELDDARLHYRQLGSGKPVVLIHGLSASGRWWHRNVDALAAHFTVYVIDLIGFGRSRGGRRFVLAEAAALVAGWMDAIGLERANVVGHSMGGYVAAQLAAEFPEKVDRLVLVDAAVPLPRQQRLHHLTHLGREMRYTPPRFLHLLATDALLAGPRTIWAAANQLIAADLEPKLDRISAPVLLVWGEHDPLVPASVADRLAERIPNVRRVVIPNCGHKPMLERPNEFNEAVIAFLAGQ
ncbi:MAG TPA: alpha/beta fold hydrolase [Thermomicrobiales bacterium]|nr:alpha/beta fold hydrolase [Thermomicrobiales bacterium]